MGRIQIICSYLSSCTTFADVGCDHGYCTQYMLENNLCEKAYIADISAKSLNKAELLLSDYIVDGRCVSVCCDGLVGLPKDINQVLIAGMGGEEIVKILKESFIPQSFVFQPMKNAQQLRSYLLENGCQITADDIFKDGKYYFIIKGNNCGNAQKYTSAQIQFGKDSLNNPLLSEYLNEEIKKNENYLLNDMSEENRRIVEKRIDYLKGVAKGEIR